MANDFAFALARDAGDQTWRWECDGCGEQEHGVAFDDAVVGLTAHLTECDDDG